MNVKEPYVRIRTSDETVRTTVASSDLTVALVIQSATGPIEDTLIQSKTDLLNLYSFNSDVVDTDHITFKTAAKLLQFTPIRVARACKSNIKSGRTDTNKVIYANETYDPFTYDEQVVFNNNLVPATGEVFITYGGGSIESFNGYSLSEVVDYLNNDSQATWLVDESLLSEGSISFNTVTPGVKVEGDGINVSTVSGNVLNLSNNSSYTGNAVYMGGYSYVGSSNLNTTGSYLGSVVTVPGRNLTYQDYLINFQDLLEVNNDYSQIAWNYLKGSLTLLNTSSVDYSLAQNDLISLNDNILSLIDDNGIMNSFELLSIGHSYRIINNIINYNGYRYYFNKPESELTPSYTSNSENYILFKVSEGKAVKGNDSYYYDILSENIYNLPVSGAKVTVNINEVTYNVINNSGTYEVVIGSNSYPIVQGEGTEFFYDVNDTYYYGNVDSTSNPTSITVKKARTNISLYDSNLSNYIYEYTLDSVKYYGVGDYVDPDYVESLTMDEITFQFYTIDNLNQKNIVAKGEGYLAKDIDENTILNVKPRNYKIISVNLEEGDVGGYPEGDPKRTAIRILNGLNYYLNTTEFSLNSNSSSFILSNSNLSFESRYSRNISIINSSGSNITSTQTNFSINSQDLVNYTLSVSSIDSQKLSNIYFSVQPQLKNSEGNWENTPDFRTFYIGNYSTENPNEELIRLTTASLNFGEWKHTLINSLKNYYNVVEKSDGFLILGDGATKWLFNLGRYQSVNFNKWTMDVFEDEYESSLNEAHFVIFNRFPSTKAESSFTLIQNTSDDEIYSLELKHGLISKTYDISFVENKVDGYGRQLFYDRVNNLSRYFYMISLNGGLPTSISYVPKVIFGNEIYVGEASSSDFVNALDSFIWSTNGVYYNILSDGGYVNSSYASALANKAIELYSIAMISMPPNLTDIEQIKEYRTATGIDTWHAFFTSQWGKDTTIGEFTALINKHVNLIERIITNKRAGMEFAPTFHKLNGVVSGTCTLYFNKKSDRESLLSNQINVVNKDLRNNTEFYIQAFTAQTKLSDLTELHNAMMVNAGAHQLDTILDQFIGQFNTADTRSTVVSASTSALNKRLFANQQYHPNEIKVVCDSTNNSEEDIESHTLYTDLYYKFEQSIWYVEAWQKVVSLSKDLSDIGNPGT